MPGAHGQQSNLLSNKELGIGCRAYRHGAISLTSADDCTSASSTDLIYPLPLLYLVGSAKEVR